MNTYYNVGKMLSEAGKHYGESIIKEYPKKLTNDLGKGYTFTILTRMRKLYKYHLNIINIESKLLVIKNEIKYKY